MRLIFIDKKIELIKYYVHDPESNDPDFSEGSAEDVGNKLIFFEYREDDPETIETIAQFYRMQYRFHKENSDTYFKRKSEFPTDFALLYYSLLNPDLIPVTYDRDLSKDFRTWLKSKENNVFSEELRERFDFEFLSPIEPSQIVTGQKYLLDANIIMGYRNWPVDPDDFRKPGRSESEIAKLVKREEVRRARNSQEITKMFRDTIHDKNIELHLVPLVLEEIDHDPKIFRFNRSIWNKSRKKFKKEDGIE